MRVAGGMGGKTPVFHHHKTGAVAPSTTTGGGPNEASHAAQRCGAACQAAACAQVEVRRPLVVGEVPMLLALAAVLAALWIISFVILHVSQAVVHVLIFGAALSTLVHFIRVRRAHQPSHEVKEIQR